VATVEEAGHQRVQAQTRTVEVDTITSPPLWLLAQGTESEMTAMETMEEADTVEAAARMEAIETGTVNMDTEIRSEIEIESGTITMTAGTALIAIAIQARTAHPLHPIHPSPPALARLLHPAVLHIVVVLPPHHRTVLAHLPITHLLVLHDRAQPQPQARAAVVLRPFPTAMVPVLRMLLLVNQQVRVRARVSHRSQPQTRILRQ